MRMLPVGLLTFFTTEFHPEILMIPHLHQRAALPAIEFTNHPPFVNFFMHFHFLQTPIGVALALDTAILLPGTSRRELSATYDAPHDSLPSKLTKCI